MCFISLKERSENFELFIVETVKLQEKPRLHVIEKGHSWLASIDVHVKKAWRWMKVQGATQEYTEQWFVKCIIRLFWQVQTFLKFQKTQQRHKNVWYCETRLFKRNCIIRIYCEHEFVVGQPFSKQLYTNCRIVTNDSTRDVHESFSQWMRGWNGGGLSVSRTNITMICGRRRSV